MSSFAECSSKILCPKFVLQDTEVVSLWPRRTGSVEVDWIVLWLLHCTVNCRSMDTGISIRMLPVMAFKCQLPDIQRNEKFLCYFVQQTSVGDPDLVGSEPFCRIRKFLPNPDPTPLRCLAPIRKGTFSRQYFRYLSSSANHEKIS
jgi:hypothetical protein